LKDEKYYQQVNKHLKILQEHAKGAPGARLADTTELKIVHTKLHTVQAGQLLKDDDLIGAEQHLKRAEKTFPKNVDHQRADEIRERIINLKLAIYKGLKHYGNVRSILEQKIKKENDSDKVGFLN